MKTRLTSVAAGWCFAIIGTGYAQLVITNQPQTQATSPGTTATFTVGAHDTAPLAYQWQRNAGAGFSDLADRTNSVLTLTNAQPWDAMDYRVVVTNISGARTSAVAHLYVMSPGLLTNRVVIDNFDDNKLTGWSLSRGNWLTETNHQLTLGGYWPGIITYHPADTITVAELRRNWSVANGQILEWRVDLVGMNQGATAAVIEPMSSGPDGMYALFKGRDFIHLNKYIIASTAPAHFLHENISLPNSNVVVVLALTRVSPDLILTIRLLDKANNSAVLYERSVVDTPSVDHTLTEAEQEAASGMRLLAVSDIQAPPWTSGGRVWLDAWQYNFDGEQPAAEVTFDNFELWTYRVPITRYVDANSTTPTPPYTNWFTAATNIQDAVDAAVAGDEIVVTNGIYATGGRAVGTNLLVNRVAVDKPLTLRSVNGSQYTLIQGHQVPGTTNGDGAIRCVYLANGAMLSGFTLTRGATRVDYDPPTYDDSSGGGVWCESTNAVVSNCVLRGNSARWYGGGVFRATINNCDLTDNSAGWGGGAFECMLHNCTLTGNAGSGAGMCTLRNCALTNNSGSVGGGAGRCLLDDCTLTGNSATQFGGGAAACTLNNCTLTGNSASNYGGGASGASAGPFGPMVVSTLNNCIVYFNTAPEGENYDEASTVLNYCCTTPLPTNGVGNITNAPLFVDFAGSNLRLQSNSPCINAGNNANVTTTTDLDGLPRIVSGTVDIGAYEFQGPGSLISYAWLQQFGLPTDGSADSADPDADGHTTWQEWRCLTDPTNALSALRLLSASPAGTNVTVSWQSVAGVNYFLERSTNVAGPPPIFKPLATGIPGQPGTTTFTDTHAAFPAPLFYRVGVGQ